MTLPKKTIRELQKIIKKDYGKTINDEQAEELGSSLLGLTRVALAVLARLKKKTFSKSS